ncbi:MAG: hypothetical protein EZS28_022775 [Streblomastix strix]|uniref:Uncharacterized protein n=1 Tax=Streblomastix strix TaxID=222440 RepID=A0A5J4VH62_9EUKA|nr:MAG: hypothetical protein EZS28_022775 [Streblomastix strix]
MPVFPILLQKIAKSNGENELAVAIASSPIFTQVRLSDFAKESYPSQKIDIDENQVKKLGLLIATIPATLNLIQLIVPAKSQSFNRIETVFEISLPIFAYFTLLIQDYQVNIKRSPLPIAYKLKREIKIRSSQDSVIVENISYTFGIKFNCLLRVITSIELLLTCNVFDKLNISGTKDDAEKRALKRAERRREEIVKQNEKRRRLEEPAQKGGSSE